MADELSGDERAVYGDRAYESKERRQRLRAMGIKDRIMHRANKHHRTLPPRLQRRNDLIAPRRSLVEKVFGTLKRSYGYSRVRYRGLQRSGDVLKLIAYNRLRKYVRLTHHAA